MAGRKQETDLGEKGEILESFLDVCKWEKEMDPGLVVLERGCQEGKMLNHY